MIDTKALDNVVELNRLSIGEFCKPNDILWIEGQQAAAQLKQLKKDCAWEEHLRENAETSYSAVYNMNLDQVEQIAQLRSDLEEAYKTIGEADMELQAAQFRTAHALLRSYLASHPKDGVK